MAKYRSLQVGFWQDNFVIELPLEEKSFYIYLLSNLRTNQCGIYNFSLTLSEVELGLSKERIRELICKFTDYGKIIYDEKTEEIMILNWYKYNVSTSRNTHVCINKELKMLKNKEFVIKFYEHCKSMKFCLDVMFQDINLVEEPSGQELLEEGSKIKNEISNEEADKIEMKEVLYAFDNNIHTATFMEVKTLKEWQEEMGKELVVLAIDEALKNNVRNIKYINGILSNWKDNGLKTLKDVKNHMRSFKSSKSNNFRSSSYDDFKPQNVGAYRIVGEDI